MKNLKQVISDVLLVVLGVMMLGFGAGYYLSAGSAGIGDYKYLERLLDGLKGASQAKPEVYLYISGMILALIFVSLLIVCALLSLLGDFKVIKNEKFRKVLNIVKIIVAGLAFISYILVLASVLEMVSIEGINLTVGYGLIVDVALSALAVLTLAVSTIKIKKKA